MSRIDELIAEHCPNGVRHGAVSEVAGYSSARVAASELDKSTFVGVDNLVANKGGRIDATYLPNTSRLTSYQVGDVLIGNIRPYLKKVWLATNSGGCSGDVLAIRIKAGEIQGLLPKFLYYLLSSDDFFAFNMKTAKGAKMPRGDKNAILNYRIPVPPREVQQEIVRILDQFKELEADSSASLEAELEARRRQYHHYRAEVVRESQKNDKYTLGTLESSGVIELGRGKIISKIDLAKTPGNYPVYSSSGAGIGEFGQYGHYMFEDERITWSVDGGGKFFYRHPHRFSVTNVSGWMTVDASILRVKYLYYVLSVQWEKEYFDYTRKAHPSVVRDIYEVSIPPLEEQRRIVEVLDKFDALVNDLSIGLPAELAARRKQYEYYRDKLLTFSEIGN